MDPAPVPTASSPWGQRFWLNAASGWAVVALRLVTGLISFRLVWNRLDGDELGFWYLIWSLAGVGVMIDLGLGVTAMRAAVRHGTDGDTATLSRVVSTCLWTTAGLGALVAVGGLVLHHPLLAALHVSESPTISRAWFAFAIGLGAVFPLSILPEVLRGCHRTTSVNLIIALMAILQVVFLGIACSMQASLDVLVTGSMGLMVFGGILQLIATWRAIPGLSLSPRLWSLITLRRQLSFSFSAYVMGGARVAIDATPSAAVSMILGLPAVALLQAASKPAQLLTQFGRQIEAPAQAGAGHLAYTGDPGGAARIGLRAAVILVALTVPGIALACASPDIVVHALTGDAEVSRTTGPLVALAICGALIAVIGELWRLTLVMIGAPLATAAVALVQCLATIAGVAIGAHLGGLAGALMGIIAATLPCTLWLAVALVRLSRTAIAPPESQGSLANMLLIAVPCAGLAWALALLAPTPLLSPIADVIWRFAIVAIPLALRGRWIIRSMNR